MYRVFKLFSTPVYSDKLIVKKEENNFIENLKYSLVDFKNGDISDDKNLLNNEKLKRVKQEILKHLEIYARKVIEIDDKISFTLQNSWAMKHKKGDYAHLHAHSNSVISGVLYTKVPKDSGNIIFHRNSFNSSNTMNPCLAIPYKNFNEYNSETWWVETKPNLIVLFPSSLTHSVPSSLTEELRYCIAFNFFIKGVLTVNGVDELVFG